MRGPRGLADAFSYFSTLPVRGGATGPGPEAARWLPLVGAVTGGLAGGVAVLAAGRLPRGLVAPSAITAHLALTGGLHLDGFLDVCDALFASLPTERRREVMKDPRHGSYALAGLVVWLALRLGATEALPTRRLPLALAAIGALARVGALANGLPGRDPATPRAGRLADLARLGPALALGSAASAGIARGGAALGPLALAAGLLAGAFVRRGLAGALPGDGYGFAIEATECVLLVAAAGASTRR